jgi:hypothetical protein
MGDYYKLVKGSHLDQLGGLLPRRDNASSSSVQFGAKRNVSL